MLRIEPGDTSGLDMPEESGCGGYDGQSLFTQRARPPGTPGEARMGGWDGWRL